MDKPGVNNLHLYFTSDAFEFLGISRLDLEQFRHLYASISIVEHHPISRSDPIIKDERSNELALVFMLLSEWQAAERIELNHSVNTINIAVTQTVPDLVLRQTCASLVDDYAWSGISSSAIQTLLNRWRTMALHVRNEQQANDNRDAYEFNAGQIAELFDVIDIEASLSRCGDSRSFAHSVREFAKSGDSLARELQTAWVNHNLLELKKAIHKLQGLAAVIIIHDLAVPLGTLHTLTNSVNQSSTFVSLFEHRIADQSIQQIDNTLQKALQRAKSVLSQKDSKH